MGRASDIGLVLHPRRDPGHVLDAFGAWAKAHGSRLMMRPADAARSSLSISAPIRASRASQPWQNGQWITDVPHSSARPGRSGMT